jgi:hypothetical protein
MQIIRLRLLAIAFLLALTPSASASQAIKANDVLLSAMSPFEDMIEFALAESDSDISTTLAAADQHTTDVKKALSASAATGPPLTKTITRWQEAPWKSFAC